MLDSARCPDLNIVSEQSRTTAIKDGSGLVSGGILYFVKSDTEPTQGTARGRAGRMEDRAHPTPFL